MTCWSCDFFWRKRPKCSYESQFGNWVRLLIFVGHGTSFYCFYLFLSALHFIQYIHKLWCFSSCAFVAHGVWIYPKTVHHPSFFRRILWNFSIEYQNSIPIVITLIYLNLVSKQSAHSIQSAVLLVVVINCPSIISSEVAWLGGGGKQNRFWSGCTAGSILSRSVSLA